MKKIIWISIFSLASWAMAIASSTEGTIPLLRAPVAGVVETLSVLVTPPPEFEAANDRDTFLVEPSSDVYVEFKNGVSGYNKYFREVGATTNLAYPRVLKAGHSYYLFVYNVSHALNTPYDVRWEYRAPSCSEPNSTENNACPIVDSLVALEQVSATDTNWFSFHIDQNSTVQFKLNALDFNRVYGLLYKDGSYVAEMGNMDGEGMLLEAGDYKFYLIYKPTTWVAPFVYNLTMKVTPIVADAYESNDDWEHAGDLGTFDNCDEDISNKVNYHTKTDKDYYKFTITEPCLFYAYLINIFDSEHRVVPIIDSIAGKDTLSHGLNAGTYYLVYENTSQKLGYYTVSLSFINPLVLDAYEDNDSYSKATTIAFNDSIRANTSEAYTKAEDRDVFKVDNSIRSLLEFEIWIKGGDMSIISKTEVWTDTNALEPKYTITEWMYPDSNEWGEYGAVAKGSLIIDSNAYLVLDDPADRIDYTLLVKQSPLPLPDIFESNNFAVNATLVNTIPFEQNHLNLFVDEAPGSDEDWFLLDLDSPQNIYVGVQGYLVSDQIQIELYNESQELIEVPVIAGWDVGDDAYSIAKHLPAGQYYVKIQELGADANIFDYSLKISTFSDVCEEGNSAVNPCMLTFNQLHSGFVFTPSDTDYFAFVVPDSSRIIINRGGNIRINLVDIPGQDDDLNRYDTVLNAGTYVFALSDTMSAYKMSRLPYEFYVNVTPYAREDAYEINWLSYEKPLPLEDTLLLSIHDAAILNDQDAFQLRVTEECALDLWAFSAEHSIDVKFALPTTFSSYVGDRSSKYLNDVDDSLLWSTSGVGGHTFQATLAPGDYALEILRTPLSTDNEYKLDIPEYKVYATCSPTHSTVVMNNKPKQMKAFIYQNGWLYVASKDAWNVVNMQGQIMASGVGSQKIYLPLEQGLYFWKSKTDSQSLFVVDTQ